MTQQKKINVGFIFLGENLWTGGVNYYFNLFYAIKQLNNTKIEVFVFVHKKLNPDLTAKLKQVATIVDLNENLIPPNSINVYKVINKIFGIYYRYILWKCKKHNIDIISHSAGIIEGNKSIPVLPWLSDFQYKYYPDFFSPKLVKGLERGYKKRAKIAKLIIVSSNHALNDFKHYHPNYASKGRVLQFVSQVNNTVDDSEFLNYQQQYNIAENFFYLPNQFWIHKNHSIVIDALIDLQARGINLQIVCTGNKHDYRFPQYFSELENKITKNKLSTNFLILGPVPYKLVNLLMVKAIAIINPSFFEGWSSSVEEAKSLGKRIILSDIPVHKEQNPKYGIFFNPHDSRQLANIILDLYQQKKIENYFNQDELTERTKQFALNYQEIILEAVAEG